MDTPTIVLNVNGIEVIYNHVILVLKGVSLDVAEGRIVLLRQERQVLDHRSAGHRLGIVPYAGLGSDVRPGHALACGRGQDRRQGCLLPIVKMFSSAGKVGIQALLPVICSKARAASLAELPRQATIWSGRMSTKSAP